jgi:hypothetical protein
MKAVEKFLNLLRSYTMRTPMWLRLLLIAPAFLLPAYWAYDFSGPYRYMAYLQTGGEAGEYSATLAYLVPCLVLLLLMVPVLILIGNFFPEKPESETKMGKKNLLGF